MNVADVMQTSVVTVTEDDTLALARQLMLWRRVRHLPVLRAGRVVGILSERDILAWVEPEFESHVVAGSVGDAMRSPVQSIGPSAPLSAAASRMSLERVGCLLVTRDEELLGILTTTDVLASVALYPARAGDAKSLGAWAVMTTNVQTVVSDDSLLDAAARMVQHGARHLPVIDGTRRVVGMLSDRDVREAIGDPLRAFEDRASSARIEALKVSDAMTPEARTSPRDAPLGALVDALVNERLGVVPVVDDHDRLLGIVSYIDLLRVLEHQLVAR